MLTMSQINHIKDLSNCGYRISEISEKTGTDPKTIRKYLSQDEDCLWIINELTGQYGFQAATSAMEMACARGNINICDASVLAARITGYGIYTPPDAGPSLAVYDEVFLKGGDTAS